MRKMPETNLYVPMNGRHPDRPWWRRSAVSPVQWIRVDGRRVYQEAETALIDRESPLPAPPIRAGQVWLLECRNATTTALLDTFGWQKPTWKGDEHAITLGGHRLTSAEARDLLLRGKNPRWKAFLIHDPIDPDAAPWTGAMEDGW
jgi:hypothetical protein